ncbi:MAG: hypothetical protein AAB408_01440 [Patescibacteria group bacterium]
MVAVTACHNPDWDFKSCPQIGEALSQRADECLPEVQASFSVVENPGTILRWWNDFRICQVIAGPDGDIEPETLSDLRICAEWIADHDCPEVGDKLKKIAANKAAKFEHPPECDPLIATIRARFKALTEETEH